MIHRLFVTSQIAYTMMKDWINNTPCKQLKQFPPKHLIFWDKRFNISSKTPNSVNNYSTWVEHDQQASWGKG